MTDFWCLPKTHSEIGSNYMTIKFGTFTVNVNEVHTNVNWCSIGFLGWANSTNL